MSLIREIEVIGIVDDSNSTATPLTGGAVFTGTATDILNSGAVFINVHTDVASATDGLSIQQSSDGTNWDHTDEYTVPAGSNKNYAINPHAKWLRVIYTNGAGAQSSFRLQTIQKGNSVPSSHRIQDSIADEDDARLVKAVLTGKTRGNGFINVTAAPNGSLFVDLQDALTAFGDLRTAEITPILQGSFEYTVDNTDISVNTEINGGVVTQSQGMCIIETSTTTGSRAEFKSAQHARYRAGLGGLARFTTMFTTGLAGTTQFAGIMDEPGSSADFKNGLAVGYDGTTFGFHRFQDDTLITVAQADWDDPMDGTGASGMTLDHTKLNVWAINFQYLGAGAITLLVESDTTGKFVVVHTVDYTNRNVIPSSFNPNYHFRLSANNGVTASNVIMKSASFAYFIEGKTSFQELHQPQNSSEIQSKAGVTAETAIFTIRNKAAYASKTNFIDIIMELSTASIEASAANNLGEIRLVKNATLGGTPAYTDINTTNSVVEIDIAGTTVTGGKEFVSFSLAGKNDNEILPLLGLKILLNPGDTLTVSGASANSATMKGSLLWKELF